MNIAKQNMLAAGPVSWIVKILVALGKTVYWVVRIVMWFLRRRRK